MSASNFPCATNFNASANRTRHKCEAPIRRRFKGEKPQAKNRRCRHQQQHTSFLHFILSTSSSINKLTSNSTAKLIFFIHSTKQLISDNIQHYLSELQHKLIVLREEILHHIIFPTFSSSVHCSAFIHKSNSLPNQQIYLQSAIYSTNNISNIIFNIQIHQSTIRPLLNSVSVFLCYIWKNKARIFINFFVFILFLKVVTIKLT